ncbi:hypothetical protein WJX79_006652 [Trebouxia sp. C0005]
MDLATLRQQILSSNKTANEKAEDLLLEHRVNDLSKDEWRQLIAGIPEDVKKEIGRLKAAAVRTLDDVTIISEATARAFHRLKQEEESEQEETTCCTTSSTPFAMAEAAARKLGFQTTKALQAKRTAAEGQALVQFLAINIRGTGPHDIIHVHFKNLEEAYAHIQWLLDRSKAENPDLRLDTSLASPAVGMFTIMEHQAQSETDSMSADDR